MTHRTMGTSTFVAEAHVPTLKNSNLKKIVMIAEEMLSLFNHKNRKLLAW